MFENYPIHDFIDKRLKELGFRRGELARRCGYKNISKGVRRIDQVCGGDLGSPSAKIVLEALPAALEVDVDTVRSAIQATYRAALGLGGYSGVDCRYDVAAARRPKPRGHLQTFGEGDAPPSTTWADSKPENGSRKW
jgi:hypothetical protein